MNLNRQWQTCLGVASFVRQGADGPQQRRSRQVLVQVEFSSGVAAVLNHTHSGFVFTYLKRTGHRRDKVADVFEVWPAHAPGAVHKEHHVCNGTDRAFWEKEIQREKKSEINTIDENTFKVF